MRDFKYLLFFRWLIINIVGFFLLGLAYLNGWIDLVIIADKTYISILIFGLFLWGLIISGVRIYKTSLEINYAKIDHPNSKWKKMVDNMHNEKLDPARMIESLKLKMFARISIVKWFANSLVMMGLIGTVIGFIIALSGVDPNMVADVTLVGKMVTSLISGLGTAMYTTLVGSALNLWLLANYHVLSEGTANLLATLLESKNSLENIDGVLDIENGVEVND